MGLIEKILLTHLLALLPTAFKPEAGLEHGSAVKHELSTHRVLGTSLASLS